MRRNNFRFTDQARVTLLAVYRFRAVCQSAEEAHIRALVVQAISRDEFVLRAVHSEDLDAGTDLVSCGDSEVTTWPLRLP
jgi:hypothetical protein